MATRLEQYQQLPEAIRNFLLDPEQKKTAKAAVAKAGVTGDAIFDVVLLADDVVLGNLPMENLPAKVAEVSKLDPEKAKSVTKDLVGIRLVPLEAFVKGIPELLATLGGKEADYPAPHVEKRKETVETFLRETLNATKLKLNDSVLQSRLEFILSSYLRGQRTHDQTIAMMARSAKVGGIELSEEEGKKVLDLIDSKKAIIDLEAAAPVAPKPVAPKPVAPKPVAPAPKSVAAPPAPKPAPVAPSPKPEGPQLAEMRAQLVASSMQKKEDERKARAALAAKEEEALSKKYVALTGKVPTVAARAPQASSGTTRVSAAVPKATEVAAMDAKAAPTARAVLRQSAPRPAPVLPKLSTPSMPPGTPHDRPQMADVKYTQKLVGPLEELGRMTLTDFHRLSPSADQATMRVKDTIDLLIQQSYAKMVEGVKAWRSSPVCFLYVSMSQEALRTGKTMAKIAEEWKAAGKEALTAEEVKAIVALNTSLRF